MTGGRADWSHWSHHGPSRWGHRKSLNCMPGPTGPIGPTVFTMIWQIPAATPQQQPARPSVCLFLGGTSGPGGTTIEYQCDSAFSLSGTGVGPVGPERLVDQ